MKKPPVALQLWSVREDTKRDFAATVGEVARMGYKGVELAGYGNLDAPGAKQALDAAGLKVAGMHVGYPALRADPTPIITDALLLGTRNVVCSWWPPAQIVSAAACEEIGRLFNEVGATLRSFGLRFGFHNHGTEFKLFDGRPGYEWILGACEPRNVFAELDVFWAHSAGYSPGRFLRDHGSRVPLVHLKDTRELGGGPVDFADVFAATDSVGATEWFIVEQEEYSHAPMESVRICLEQMRKWGRA
jgi:sugar phosphate isomerase/epimerase